MKPKAISKEDWIALLESANAAPKSDPIPKGYHSMSEWLEEFRISETTWRRKIPILEEKGVMVVGHFRVLTKDNRIFKKPFWKKGVHPNKSR